MRSLFLVALAAILLALFAASTVWAQVIAPSPQGDLVSPVGESPAIEEAPGGNIDAGGSTPEVTETINPQKKEVRGGNYNQKSVWNYQKTYTPPDFGRTSSANPSPPTKSSSTKPTSPSQKKSESTIGHEGVYQVFLGKNGQPGPYGLTTVKSTESRINKAMQNHVQQKHSIAIQKKLSVDEQLAIIFASTMITIIFIVLAIGIHLRKK